MLPITKMQAIIYLKFIKKNIYFNLFLPLIQYLVTCYLYSYHGFCIITNYNYYYNNSNCITPNPSQKNITVAIN